MNLREAIRDLDSFDVEGTIYAARPWNEKSTAIVALEPISGSQPEEAERLGLEYFLEIFIAREILDMWISSGNEPPTLEEKCSRLIAYAIDDS